MKMIVLFLLASITGLSVKSQDMIKDTKAIENQIEAFNTSWNNHNFNDMATYTTPDADWVNVRGMYWKDRKEVEFAHQFFHDRMFKNTPIKTNWIKIKFVTADVAVAHVNTHAGSYITPNGTSIPEEDNMALMMFVKQGNKWLLTSCENVNIDAEAAKHDPVLHIK